MYVCELSTRVSLCVYAEGHWGANSCYPGAEKVMRGVAAYFETPSYMEVRKVSVV